jgi:type IV pilus assembly protein PilN
MIRINLLASERERTKKRAVTLGTVGQKLTIGCSLILILAALFCGWRYWTVTRESAQLDAEIAAAQQESGRLRSIIVQVQQFEQRKAQLQQRVVLIEQLRTGQTGPVHMLDQISRALPPMLWLTAMKQANAEVIMEGKATTLTGLSEFVSNLETSGYFKRSVEIVNTTTDPASQSSASLIRFTIKAVFQRPGEAAPAAPATKTGG